jgi:hypothetical protein
MSNLEIEEYVPETVTLRQPADSSVPMPDPDFLRLHYQVAKILDQSGIDRKLARACGQTARVASDIAPDGSTDLERALNVNMLMDI